MLIGLVGKKRVGKDTICEIIQESYTGVQRIAFADKLKESVAYLFNIPYDQVDMFKMNPNIRIRMIDEGDNAMNFTGLVDMDFRTILQRYGTEAHREVFGSDFWVKAALPPNFIDFPSVITVVTDVRFVNEAKHIKSLGGVLWYVTRPDTDTSDAHASETELEQIKELCTIHLENDGTLTDLGNKVREACWESSKLIYKSPT